MARQPAATGVTEAAWSVAARVGEQRVGVAADVLQRDGVLVGARQRGAIGVGTQAERAQLGASHCGIGCARISKRAIEALARPLGPALEQRQLGHQRGVLQRRTRLAHGQLDGLVEERACLLELTAAKRHARDGDQRAVPLDLSAMGERALGDTGSGLRLGCVSAPAAKLRRH